MYKSNAKPYCSMECRGMARSTGTVIKVFIKSMYVVTMLCTCYGLMNVIG